MRAGCIRGLALAVAALFIIPACSGGGGTGSAAAGAGLTPALAPLVVSAGVETLDPAATDTVSATVSFARLGLAGVTEVYDLTSPAGKPFNVTVASRSSTSDGAVILSIAHALDGGATPAGGAASLADAGILLNGSGLGTDGNWLNAEGDGFSRLTIQGEISRPQVLALRGRAEERETTALLRILIGPESKINVDPPAVPLYPGILDARTLYSSNSWSFGLPTVAVSGDRTSVVTYEGDGSSVWSRARYEMRLQYDGATGAVTGGATEEINPDSGNWRDHEIAALFNILAVVSSGTDSVGIRLSFDRGATFGQTHVIPTVENRRSRLVQVAMALDYTLAVLYWDEEAGGTTSRLRLAEGRPSAFDGTGSPTRFLFGTPETIASFSPTVTPTIMGAEYSVGGDLAIGYGFTQFLRNADRPGTTALTQYWSAVRLFGSGFARTLVEEDRITNYDPSVSLVGSGSGMTVFFAYETVGGIRLRVSTNGGASYSAPFDAGLRGAHLPSVFARRQAGKLRVDLLYLQPGGEGTELRLTQWNDFGISAPTDHRLTTASSTLLPPPPGPIASGLIVAMPGNGRRTTQVGWFGYDATLDGDDVVLVYDEHTYELSVIFLGPPIALAGDPMALAGTAFVAADPPPLAPGLTKPVAPPDPNDMHQLKFLRLD